MACIYTSLLQQKKKSPAVKTYKRLLISEARRKRGSERVTKKYVEKEAYLQLRERFVR